MSSAMNIDSQASRSVLCTSQGSGWHVQAVWRKCGDRVEETFTSMRGSS
jgi:hypothetical protein